MSIYSRVYGNTTANKYQIPLSLVGGFSTFSYGAAIVVFRAPSDVVGATSANFLSTHDSVSDGIRFYFQSGDLFGYWRTSGTSAAVKLIDNYVPGELYVVGLHAATNGVQQFTVNGEIVATTISMAGGVTLRGASNMRPWIQGINLNGFDLEVSDFAFWVSNTESDIPTIGDLQGYQAGTTMLTAAAATKIHLKAVGTAGTPVTQFTDQISTNHATHTAGDLDDSAGNRPIYVELADPVVSFSVTPTTTARTLSLDGNTLAAGGTVYCVVDTSVNLPSAPDATDVVGGFLGDGTTAALLSDSSDMTGITDFLLSFSGVPVNTQIAYALVHDTNDAGSYTSVVYGEISTKRPVVVPSGTDKALYSSDGTLLASETNITLDILDDLYSESGLSTSASGILEVNLTGYVNAGGAVDIGDTIGFDLTRSNGEVLAARNQTITEGS